MLEVEEAKVMTVVMNFNQLIVKTNSISVCSLIQSNKENLSQLGLIVQDIVNMGGLRHGPGEIEFSRSSLLVLI